MKLSETDFSHQVEQALCILGGTDAVANESFVLAKADEALKSLSLELYNEPDQLAEYEGFGWDRYLLREGHRLPSKHLAAIRWMRGYCWHTVAEYHPIVLLKRTLAQLSILWARVLLTNPDSILDNSRAINRIFEKLKPLLQTVDGHCGTASRQYCQNLYRKIALSARAKVIENQDTVCWQACSAVEKVFINQRKENIKRISQEYRERVKRLESGAYVNKVVRQAIGEGQLPVIMLEFMESYAAVILEHLYLTNGPKGTEWKETIKDIKFVVWGFKAPVDEQYRQLFSTQVLTPLRRLLERVEPLVSLTKRTYRDFMAVEQLLTDRYQGFNYRLETVYNAVSLDATEFFSTKTNRNRWRKDYPAGRPFLVIEGPNESRCFAAGFDISKRFLLFLNHSGEVVYDIDTEHFNFDPFDIAAIPIEVSDRDNYVLSSLRQELTYQYREMLTQNQDRIEQAEQQQQAARNKEQLARKNLALQKKKLRQQRVVELKELRALRERKQRQQAELDKRHQQFREVVNRLKPSAQLTWKVQNLSEVTLELVLITATTKRYILSDRSGRNHLSASIDELIEKFLAGELEVVNYGQEESVHQTLSDIVKLQRERQTDHHCSAFQSSVLQTSG